MDGAALHATLSRVVSTQSHNALHSMTATAIVEACRAHNLWSWSTSNVEPIVLTSARGVWLTGANEERWIDFNSGLMCCNIGHGHPRVVQAIQEQVSLHTLLTCNW